MGQPKTQTVGGGSATGTADAFNQFLMDGLKNGSFGSSGVHFGGTQTGPNGAAVGLDQATGQTNSFGNAINSMLGGTVGNPSTYSQFFDQMKNQGDGGYTFGAGQPGYNTTNFGQVNGTNSFNQLFGANGQGGMFGAGHPAMAGGANAGVNLNAFGKPADAFGAEGTGGLLNYDVNSPEFQALKHMQDRQTSLDTANVRARFGAGGGSSLSSGASLAESQYLAEANPRNILNLQQMGQNMQQLDMSNRGLNAQTLLSQRGQNVDLRGQDVNSATATSIASANNATQASIANAGNSNQFNLARMTAALQSMGMDADSAYRAAMANNNNMFGENQARNAYDQSGYQFGVNTGMANQGMKNQFALGQAGIGTQMAGLSQQGISSILQQLFGSYNQANQIGTPQAQTVQNPSMFGQIMSGVGGLVNMGTSIYNAANPFGRNGAPQGGSFGGTQSPFSGGNPLMPNQRVGSFGTPYGQMVLS